MNYQPSIKRQEYQIVIKDVFTTEFIINNLKAIKPNIISPVKYTSQDTSHLMLWSSLLCLLATEPFASRLHHSMSALTASLQPFLNYIFRHLSLYVKTDGTKFVCLSDNWNNIDSARAHILRFIDELSDEKFALELSQTMGLSVVESAATVRSTVAALNRIVNATDVESWISEILDVLVLFNSMQMIDRKSSELERFTKSFQLDSDIESKRALGARTYWRGRSYVCTSSGTLHLPAFLIYVLFAKRTDSVIYEERFTLTHPVPTGLTFDLPSEGVSQMLSVLIKTICGEVPVEVTRQNHPIAESFSRDVPVKRGVSQRSMSTATRPKDFKYLVDVDNGRLKIYVRTYEELLELRRSLIDQT